MSIKRLYIPVCPSLAEEFGNAPTYAAQANVLRSWGYPQLADIYLESHPPSGFVYFPMKQKVPVLDQFVLFLFTSVLLVASGRIVVFKRR